MNKLEAKFQTEFNRWLKYNYYETACFELKVAREAALPFSAVAPHQIQNLQAAKHRKIIYKIPDDSFGQKPFDCFCISEAQGFIAIQYVQEEPGSFVIIDIDAFCDEMKKSKRRSLTYKRALEIGENHILKKMELVL